jgi:hypothetical protein
VATPRPQDLISVLSPAPRGANNLAREDSVPVTAVRDAQNVDFYPGGKFRRRKGFEVLLSTPLRNIWSGDGEYALCTSEDGQTLYRVDPNVGLTELYVGLRPESDVAYTLVNDLVCVSDGVTMLRVGIMDGSVRPWGVPRPAGNPVLSAVDGGLPPGDYQVTTTHATEDGEESGSPDVASYITLPNGGGIRVQQAAFSVDPSVTRINVYVSRAGGEKLRRYGGSYPAGVLDITIGPSRLGRPLLTRGLEQMVAGHLLAFAGGRLLSAVDNLLFFSPPLYYGLVDIVRGYHAFAGAIDMIAPAQPAGASTGIFVAAGGKTYFLSLADGDVVNATSPIAYHVGAVRGTPIYIDGSALGMDGIPAQPIPVWLAKNGMPCAGLPTGQVVALTNLRYEMDVGERFSMAQRELFGINHIVVGVRNPIVGSQARAMDSAEVTLVRNGIEIP